MHLNLFNVFRSLHLISMFSESEKILMRCNKLSLRAMFMEMSDCLDIYTVISQWLPPVTKKHFFKISEILKKCFLSTIYIVIYEVSSNLQLHTIMLPVTKRLPSIRICYNFFPKKNFVIIFLFHQCCFTQWKDVYHTESEKLCHNIKKYFQVYLNS